MSPQPRLARLPLLLAQSVAPAWPSSSPSPGRPAVAGDVELNAYRIVQEALTNSLKHAGPTSTAVPLEYGPGSLQIEVRDQGGTPSTTPPSTGFGLVGMQQRATMLGGVLVAGSGGGPWLPGLRPALPLAGAAT